MTTTNTSQTVRTILAKHPLLSIGGAFLLLAIGFIALLAAFLGPLTVSVYAGEGPPPSVSLGAPLILTPATGDIPTTPTSPPAASDAVSSKTTPVSPPALATDDAPSTETMSASASTTDTLALVAPSLDVTAATHQDNKDQLRQQFGTVLELALKELDDRQAAYDQTHQELVDLVRQAKEKDVEFTDAQKALLRTWQNLGVSSE